MNELEKLNSIFVEVFNVDVETLNADFNSTNIEGWDSVRQLSLTSSIEDTFDIMLDPEDILGCNSYEAAKEILKKYGIEL